MDEATKVRVEQLAKEAIERYRLKVGKSEKKHPMNNLKAALAEEKEVNRLLRVAGYEKPEELSKCARAGLIRGHFVLKFIGKASQLDTVVCKAKCSGFHKKIKCPGTLKATVRKLLEQQDYAGLDFENNSKDATVKCEC